MKTVLTFKFALFAVLFGGCSNGNSFYSSSTRPVKRSVSASKNIETRLPSGLRLEVSPLTFEIPTGTTQQLVATAIYDLDYRRDVTKEVVWRVDVAAAANAKMSESQAGLVNGLLPGSGGLTVTLNGALTGEPER